MTKVQFGFRLVILGAAAFLSVPTLPAQDTPPAPHAQLDKFSRATLKISLRLPDQTPFLGAAGVELLSPAGDTILSTRSEAPGDYLFPGISPGNYSLEVSAPGYLSVRLTTAVEQGIGQRTLFVPMNPAIAAKPEIAAQSTTPHAAHAGFIPVSSRDFWRPHELEQLVPPVDPAASCPADDVLLGVGQRMTDFVATLERFIANEHVEHYPVDHKGGTKSVERRSFTYLVNIASTPHGFLLDEYRNGSTDPTQFPGNIATEGLPAMSLIFHPALSSGFSFRCEGLGRWADRQLWQVYFVQRADRPVQIRGYILNGKHFGMSLEGRVWIDPGNYQVVRLESELVKPIEPIELTREHLAVTYAPVHFASTGQELWLPREAELFVERRGRRYYRRHTFTDFQLFNVQTLQTLEQPKSSYAFTNLTDRDVAGVFTVVPAEGLAVKQVTLRFTLPPHVRLFKTVGLGKDINLPPDSVASAQYAYSGKPGAVQVDALLANETTLDVLSNSFPPPPHPTQPNPALPVTTLPDTTVKP